MKADYKVLERTYGFAKYLHDSLPNATYVGFTGTPIDPTIEVFGGIVDSYTMTESVRDGIPIGLLVTILKPTFRLTSFCYSMSLITHP